MSLFCTTICSESIFEVMIKGYQTYIFVLSKQFYNGENTGTLLTNFCVY